MGEKRKRSDKSHSEAEIVVGGVSETPEKRQKVESAEPWTPQPLTRENLALLEGNMPGPKRNRPEEDSGSITDSGPTSDISIRKTSEALDYRGLKFCEKNTERAPLVVQVATWVMGDRPSKMSDEEAESFETARYKHRQRDRATFIERVWCLLLLQTRTIKKNAGDDPQDNDELVRKAWEADYLDWTSYESFYPDSIPIIDAKDEPVLKVLLDRLPKIKVPKPDRAYGLDDKAFTEEERNINTVYKHVTRAARSVNHPFFVVASKSHTGVLAEAQFQARRSGASLMGCLRRFKNLAGILNEATSQDHGNYVFSLALTPDIAQLYLHWAVSEPNENVTYHMHELNSYSMSKPRDVKELRRDVENVMDWGLGPRKDYIKNCLSKIKERDSDIKQATSSSKAASLQSKAASSKAASTEAAGPVPAVTEDTKGEDTEDEDLA